MKTLLLAALLGLTVAYVEEELSVFRGGKEYLYDYESQVLSGVDFPVGSPQLSGIKIKAVARIQIGSNYRAVLKLDDLKVMTVNSKVGKLPAHEIIEDHELEPLDAEREELYKAMLEKPLKFRYELGLVSQVEVEAEEPEWSCNIKKGVLSLLQLDLSQENEIHEIEPHFADAIQKNMHSWDKSYDQAWRVNEEAVDGECESIYVVRAPVEAYPKSEKPELLLTKIRNYDNCEVRPAWQEGAFSGYVADINNKKEGASLVKAINHMDYILKHEEGDRTSFVIKELKQAATYLVSPLSKEDGSQATYVVQVLKVRETRDTINPIQPSREMRTAILLHTFEHRLEDISERSPWRSSSDKTSSTARIEVVDKLLEAYVEASSPYVSEETPDVLHKIMYVLRTASSEELMAIVDKLVAESEEKVKSKKLETFLTLLQTAGKPEVIPVVTKLIKDGIYGKYEAALVINQIALTIRPSVEVVRALLPSSELFNLPVAQSTYTLRQSLILALGTSLHGLTEAARKERISKAAYVDITAKCVQELTELYESAREEGEKMSVLKAIANSGLPDFLKLVERELLDKEAPLGIRMNAVFALRRMPSHLAKKIQYLLLPIYMDPNEPYGLRCVAYLSIVHAGASYGQLQMIVHSLREERSVQVGSFVYAHLIEIAESERHSLAETKKHVKALVQQIKPIIPRSFYKGAYSVDMLSKKLGLGAHLDMYVMDSPSTVFPSGIVGKLGTTLMGQELNMAETGIDIEGLESIMSRLIGPDSLLRELLEEDTFKENVLDIIREVLLPARNPDMGRVESKIREIIERLGLKERIPKEFKYSAYIKLFGNEIRHFMVSRSDLLEYIAKNKMPLYEILSEVISECQKGMAVNWMGTYATETGLTIPTAAGIPLSINLTYTHAIRIVGNIKMEGNPIALLLEKPEKIKIVTDLMPSAVVSLTGSVGVHLPLLRSGVEVKAKILARGKLPIEINHEPESGAVALKYKLPEESMEAIKVVVVPATYLHKIHAEPSVQVLEAHVKEIVHEKYIKPINFKLPCEVKSLGLRIEPSLEISTPIVSFYPSNPLKGKYSCSIIVAPIKREEMFMEIKVQIPRAKEDARESFEPEDEFLDEIRSKYHESSERIDSRSAIGAGLFEEVRADSIIEEAWPIHILSSVSMINTPVPYKRVNKVTILADKSLLKWQVNLQSAAELSGKKLLANIVVNIPALLMPMKKVEAPELIAKIELGHGSSYKANAILKVLSGDKGAKMEVPVEPTMIYLMRKALNLESLEMTMIEKTSESRERQSSSWKSWLFGKSSGREEYEREEIKISAGGMEMISRSVMPIEEEENAYKYTVELEYEGVPEWVREYARYVLKAAAIYDAKNVAMLPNRVISHGKMQAIIRVLPHLEMLHLLVEVPGKDVIFYVPAPWLSYPYSPAVVRKSVEEIKPSEIREEGRLGSKAPTKAECAIYEENETSKTVVRTFDKVSYEMPALSEDCEVVVAKDCTPSHLFTIIASIKEGVRTVQLLLPKTDIKVLIPGAYDRSIKAIINGREELIRDGEKKKLEIELKKEKKPIIAEIIREGDLVTIELEKLGLRVHLKKRDITIQGSLLHSGRVCGICGDFNGDVVKELTGPKEKLYKKAKEMVLSYVLPSERCDVEELRAKHNVVLKSTLESCRTELRTIVRQRGEETCLSIKPVSVCPKNCEILEEKTKFEAFHCLPAHELSTRRLVKDSMKRPLHELSGRSMDKYLEVDIHEECAPWI